MDTHVRSGAACGSDGAGIRAAAQDPMGGQRPDTDTGIVISPGPKPLR
jgi:hypothetical protein